MKVRQSKDICVAHLPNSIVIFNCRTYRSYVCNDTARLVWNFCKKPRSLNQISRFFSHKYQIGLSKTRRDINRLIHQLKKRMLIVCS
ncbi:MAG: PqqD family protein [Candidatus Omnitrophota bacterium]|nr:PqqD family protein [Candidatus Omnitrophota bacterium]